MKQELDKVLSPTKEEITLLRFSLDLEKEKIQIEGISKKYNIDNGLINSESLYLIFRDENYAGTKNFILSGNIESNNLRLLLRKLEIDRDLAEGDLCEPLPSGVGPIKEK